jgi:hypothetical protein
MNTDIEWGERLVKMMIFFDNVRFIPENGQPGKECCCEEPCPRVPEPNS